MTTAIVFLLVLLALLGHGFFWVGLVNRIHAWGGPRIVVDLLTLLCELMFVVLPLLVANGRFSQRETALGYLTGQIGLAQCYLFACIGWGAVKTILALATATTDDEREALLDWQQQRIDIADQLEEQPVRGLYTRLARQIPGNQILQLTVDRKRLSIGRLPESLSGLKLVHISDVHMTGRIGPRYFQAIAQQVNLLEPDVVAITGDLVESEACWPWLADSLGKLSARLGVYFVLGNHDKYVDYHQTRALLEQQGLISLGSRCVTTLWDGVEVVLAGNELPWIPGEPDLGNVAAKSSDQFRLMLLHTPDQLAWACRHDADLVLAGHTHGGQIRFPLFGAIACPSYYGTRYACGVFRHGATVMHVTRGLSGKAPLRLNCPPEIALLELVGGE